MLTWPIYLTRELLTPNIDARYMACSHRYIIPILWRDIRSHEGILWQLQRISFNSRNVPRLILDICFLADFDVQYIW